ncbi:MAG TPA: O-phosphoserine--tRNA ligase [Candidatus Methanomethylia archaeon]|nr:O-phosphoserine--tRNA ligase [Candidatus Methanomethylicia archaeon]
MPRFNIKEILKKAEEDFEKAWLETRSLLTGKGVLHELPAPSPGSSHVLYDVIQRFREVFMEMGFEEVVNPMIVEESDIFKQYGHEAPAILDRCYYLAVLPRPDVGMSKEKVEALKKLGISVEDSHITALQKVLHQYKKGAIDGDDLVEEIAKALKVNDATATKVLNEVFPEFRKLEPQPTKLMLRSHMTSAWFLTLAALQRRKPHPIKLFSVGPRIRREQREDETHLRVHHAASSVILDEEVSIEDGRILSEYVLRRFGFEKIKVVKKEVTAKYYAPGTEYEVFICKDGFGWVEVVDFGLYSPIALARYGIEYPVLNAGIGVERVAALLQGIKDVRELVYPQFYGEWVMSDWELASYIYIEKAPATKEGEAIARAIVKCIEEHSEASSPCSFTAYKGSLLGKEVEVEVYEHDPGVKLVGPAAFNVIYVYDGNILGIPPKGLEEIPLVREAREKGVSTGIRYLDAVAAYAAALIEDAALKGEPQVDLRVRIAKRPSDVNIRIAEIAERYVTGRNRRIDVRGPVFIGVRAKLHV